jgi:beta-ribofuranosylaminobenzene 5'-phosphate synthase
MIRRPSIRETGDGAWGVRVTAASRLSFTLIDLHGGTGRRNGMASLSLATPSFRASVVPADQMKLVLDSESAVYEADIHSFLGRLSSQLNWAPVEVRVDRGLPAHTGFGSKTTTLLALGKAWAALEGAEVSTAELARHAGRGGTSGASVNLIDQGGYLVDGGHANPSDFDEDPQKYLVPSRFARVASKPPPLIQLPFPAWPILLMITEGTKLHGEPELAWFRETLPIPLAEAQRTAHHVLFHLSTAVAEADYPAFCRALNMLTYQHYYKQKQIEIQPEPVREMFRAAREHPAIDAICISVTGPMCYAMTRRPSEALRWCASLQEQGVLREFWFSGGNNRPCLLEAVPR